MPIARTLDTASIFLFVGLLAWFADRGKIIPGGPFISITGNIVPLIGAAIAIWASLPYVAYPRLKIILSAVTHIALATSLAGIVLYSIITFWIKPFARGDLIGL